MIEPYESVTGSCDHCGAENITIYRSEVGWICVPCVLKDEEHGDYAELYLGVARGVLAAEYQRAQEAAAEVRHLREAIQDTYTAPDAAAFFAAEGALRKAVQGEAPASLTDLIRQVKVRGWRWEGGHYHAACDSFYARVYLPNLDPIHYDSPADERWGYGSSVEEATQRAFEQVPPNPHKTKE